MKPLRDLQRRLHRMRGPVFAIVTLVAIGSTLGGWALPVAGAQQPQAIPIQVNGETVWLEPGKNVHPHLYSGSDYYINDPIDGSTYKRLSYYPTPSETAEYRAN